MAINKVVYGSTTLIDLTDSTLSDPSDLMMGVTAYDRTGTLLTGTGTGGTAVTQDENGYLVLEDDEVGEITLTSLSVTQNGTIIAPSGVAYSQVTANVNGSGIVYLYSDLNGETPVNIGSYQYASVDFAPVHDGKARMWIEVDSSDLTFTAPISVPTYSSYRYSGLLDWGDGSPEVAFDYNNQSHTHTYSEPGRYCFSAWRTGGAELFCLKSSMTTADANKILAIEWYAVGYSTNNPSSYMANLRKIRWSSAQTEISFTNCESLVDVVFPESLTTIMNFYRMSSLKKLVIPAGVTTINGSAFSNNTAMTEYHFLSTTPPTLGSNAFQNIPSGCVIYVPSASLSAYQTAENWSTYASKMVGE